MLSSLGFGTVASARNKGRTTKVPKTIASLFASGPTVSSHPHTATAKFDVGYGRDVVFRSSKPSSNRALYHSVSPDDYVYEPVLPTKLDASASIDSLTCETGSVMDYNVALSISASDSTETLHETIRRIEDADSSSSSSSSPPSPRVPFLPRPPVVTTSDMISQPPSETAHRTQAHVPPPLPLPAPITSRPPGSTAASAREISPDRDRDIHRRRNSNQQTVSPPGHPFPRADDLGARPYPKPMTNTSANGGTGSQIAIASTSSTSTSTANSKSQPHTSQQPRRNSNDTSRASSDGASPTYVHSDSDGRQMASSAPSSSSVPKRPRTDSLDYRLAQPPSRPSNPEPPGLSVSPPSSNPRIPPPQPQADNTLAVVPRSSSSSRDAQHDREVASMRPRRNSDVRNVPSLAQPVARPAAPSRPTVNIPRVRWNENLICPSPIPPSQRRKGWFNRRGDQLWTNEGKFKSPEPGQEYPPDLEGYPEPGEGWQNEEGVRIDLQHRLIPKQPRKSALKRTSTGGREQIDT